MLKTMKTKRWLVVLAAGIALPFFSMTLHTNAADESSRGKANKLRGDGNWAEALLIYRDLLTGDQRIGGEPERAQDVGYAFQCVRQLG